MHHARTITNLTAALAMAVLLALPVVSAADEIDQNQPSGPVYMAGFSQGDLAQSFMQANANISGAAILLQSGVGSSDTVTIQLWDALPNGGGTMLAQASATGFAAQWVDVFWTPVNITPMTTYYLVFTGNTSLGIAGDTANPYPYGQVYANAGFGSFSGFDYAFRTYYFECETDNECDDGLYCTGVETCDNGTCVATGDPCGDGTPLCDEDNDVCVECLSDDNCTEGQFCDEGVCRFPCSLFIKYKEIRAEKLTKDRTWVFTVTGEEDFDVFGLIDFGPLTWRTVKFNAKKKRLKIIATVPAGLAPGAYPVSVGECSGEIVVTGSGT